MIFWRLRVLLYYALISIVCIVFVLASALLIALFKPSYSFKYRIAVAFSYCYIVLAKYICGLKYEISGLEKLPKEPSIVLANHQSFWDNVIMQLIIPEHSWVIKKQLYDIPFFGWGLRMLKPIAVDRKDFTSINQILREGVQKIQSGLWMIIFPESTRVGPEVDTKFKPSAIVLASNAKVPIVLIAHNAGVFWPKAFWIRQPGTIKLKIVGVIPKEDLVDCDVRAITERAQNIINREKQILFEEATRG